MAVKLLLNLTIQKQAHGLLKLTAVGNLDFLGGLVLIKISKGSRSEENELST